MEKPSPLTARNEQIKGFLRDGKIPMLPFEAIIHEERLGLLKEKQGSLSVLLRAAMEESSETWHDNAPADAIADESKIISAKAHRTLAAQFHSEIIPYPSQSIEEATIGSLIAVTFSGDIEQESILLTGSVRELHREVARHLPDNTNCATIESPLGEALFDSKPGDLVSYRVNGREVQVQVVQIVQLTPSLLQ
jgi:transcription elongation GreA/GreB family factor